MKANTTQLIKKGKSAKGFSLVEVLIALAVLMIISVALLMLFNYSFEGIIKAGKKAESIYDGQGSLENKITEDKSFDAETDLTLRFTDEDDEAVTVIVHGKNVKPDEDIENVDLTMFQTKNSEKVKR